MNTSVTRLDACQSLLASPSNSTVTNWADHGEPCRHAALTCSLRGSRNGLRGDQRSGAGGPGGTPRGVRLPLENRAVAPRRHSGDRGATLPGPYGAHPVSSSRQCVSGGGEAQRTRSTHRPHGGLTHTRAVGDLQKNKIPYIVEPLTGTSSQVLYTDERFL